jgi:type I restriction enzyme, S subunit
MSKIAGLVTKHCPSGVKFESLKNIGTWYGGGTPSKSKSEYWQNGTIPWLSPKDMGKPIIESTEDYITAAAVSGSATKLIPANSVTIVVRSSILDKTLPVALVPMPVTLNQDMKAVVTHKGILPSYIAHLLRSRGPELLRKTRKTGGSVASIEVPKLMSFRVPIPPVAVQKEIVKVLDDFTALTADLEIELKAELEARRLQYSHYRNALFSFDDADIDIAASKQASRVRWASLESICMKTNNIKWKENPGVDFAYIDLSSVSRDNNKITETQTINAKTAPSRAQQIVHEDDVIFGTTRPTLRRFCFIPKKYDGQICSTGFCVLRADKKQVSPKYLYFSLTTTVFNEYVERNQEGAGYPAISDARVKAFKIPVPPLEEQERIVSILNNFDSLVNDISEGLPAEISARRQQYEYYRDRLLTFQEAA